MPKDIQPEIRRLYGKLRAALTDHAPGDRFFSYQTLIGRFRTSRRALEQALARLEAEELIRMSAFSCGNGPIPPCGASSWSTATGLPNTGRRWMRNSRRRSAPSPAAFFHARSFRPGRSESSSSAG